jgi:tripartite-type tricarboxylate transporter receptor subunit TctC
VKLLAAFAASLSLSIAHAQPYPSKPIRIIVPYAPGGTSDILARQIGPKLTEAWSQPVIVENKPGANGNVGADFVAKSAPDGYTLLLTDVGGLVISASVYPKLPFNPSKDFSPVVMVSYSPHVLAVHPSVKAGNVKELIALAKANPGKLTSVQGGRLKAIAISSAKRMPSAPDTPTVAEQGLPGFETGSFQGLVGPKGMPKEVTSKLNGELVKVLNLAEMKERFAKQGTEVRAGTPESLGQWLSGEQAKWARVVKESGAKFE